MGEAAVSWDDVVSRLAAARVWWVCTSHPARGPHCVPTWGVVVDGVPHIFGAADSRRNRDLAADPRAVVHLESGEDVLIVRGTFVDVGSPEDNPDVCAAYRAKYAEPDDPQYLPDADPEADVHFARLEPARALTWTRDSGYQPSVVEGGGLATGLGHRPVE
jgi:hypothetical protein